MGKRSQTRKNALYVSVCHSALASRAWPGSGREGRMGPASAGDVACQNSPPSRLKIQLNLNRKGTGEKKTHRKGNIFILEIWSSWALCLAHFPQMVSVIYSKACRGLGSACFWN